MRVQLVASRDSDTLTITAPNVDLSQAQDSLELCLQDIGDTTKNVHIRFDYFGETDELVVDAAVTTIRNGETNGLSEPTT